MPFIVIYDANVLVGNTQRDFLIQIAQTGLVQAKWTDRILDEALAAVQKSRPDIQLNKLAHLRRLMIEAVPDCLVTGYEPLIEGLHLGDPDDRHVLAAAIKSGAQADPEPRQADADDECWRGLAVVAALSTRWACERSGYRRDRVWAELAL